LQSEIHNFDWIAVRASSAWITKGRLDALLLAPDSLQTRIEVRNS